MELSNYFQLVGQDRALVAYAQFARRVGWPTHEMVEMYEAARFVFDATVPEAKALEVFTTKIYGMLSSHWQVFRTRIPQGREKCWSAQQVFETIKREFSQFAWDSRSHLMGTIDLQSLLPCLVKMKNIKPHTGYPIMAVSKFLHFYNPALFPIYDEKVVWQKVFDKRFDRDFRTFHEEFNLTYNRTEDTVFWYRNYIQYASYLVSSAHPKFMEVFADWLRHQPGCHPGEWTIDPRRLYATAFEFTVIGAAESEELRCMSAGA